MATADSGVDTVLIALAVILAVAATFYFSRLTLHYSAYIERIEQPQAEVANP